MVVIWGWILLKNELVFHDRGCLLDLNRSALDSIPYISFVILNIIFL